MLAAQRDLGSDVMDERCQGFDKEAGRDISGCRYPAGTLGPGCELLACASNKFTAIFKQSSSFDT
jgi:hypothetical protein